ncbi:MAG TPA: hypothetical protein VF490_21850 [Chryseosolibacter sp.]
MFHRTDHNGKFFITAFVVSLLVTTLSACDSKKRPAAFYPVDSLVTAQIRHLNSIHAEVLKEALLRGQKDTAKYTPKDTLAWINELDVFRRIDMINKPVNKGLYRVDDGLVDPQSNLTVKSFKSIKDLPVVYLKIFYQGTLHKPRRIEALYREENVLFGSSRVLSMDFQQIGDKTVLTGYEIKGGEKMVFGDTVEYYIRGKILVD